MPRPRSATAPPLVTLHIWRIPTKRVGTALRRVATDRRRLVAAPGLRFGRLVGTGRGLSLRGVELRRWALVAAWSNAEDAEAFESSPLVRSWAELAEESFRVDLRPLSSRGRWGGSEPFGAPVRTDPTGAVAALTRARVRPHRLVRFWRSVPPVEAAVGSAAGLRFSMGFGEVPIVRAGTFSLWTDERALRAFAYDDPRHAEVRARTPGEGWYAEELFARFAVLGTSGTLGGRDVLA